MNTVNAIKSITKAVTIPAINPALVEFGVNFPEGESAERDVEFSEDGIEFSGGVVEFAEGDINFVEANIVLVELDRASVDGAL